MSHEKVIPTLKGYKKESLTYFLLQSQARVYRNNLIDLHKSLKAFREEDGSKDNVPDAEYNIIVDTIKALDHMRNLPPEELKKYDCESFEDATVESFIKFTEHHCLNVQLLNTYFSFSAFVIEGIIDSYDAVFFMEDGTDCVEGKPCVHCPDQN